MSPIVELESVVRLVNTALEYRGREAGYAIDHAYGRVRLVRRSGSVEVSPRLPTRALLEWCRAFYAGILAGSPYL